MTMIKGIKENLIDLPPDTLQHLGTFFSAFNKINKMEGKRLGIFSIYEIIFCVCHIWQHKNIFEMTDMVRLLKA